MCLYLCVCVCCREIKCQHWSWAVHAVPLLCLLPTSPPPTTVAPSLTRSLTSLPRQTGNTVVLCSRPLGNHLCSLLRKQTMSQDQNCGSSSITSVASKCYCADAVLNLGRFIDSIVCFFAAERKWGWTERRSSERSWWQSSEIVTLLPFKRMNHPTFVHLHYTFSSYKYIFAYRLYYCLFASLLMTLYLLIWNCY